MTRLLRLIRLPMASDVVAGRSRAEPRCGVLPGSCQRRRSGPVVLPAATQFNGRLLRLDPALRPVRTEHRWVGGVAGGVAQRLGVDATLVRCIWVVLSILTGLGAIIYALGWAFLPEESDGRIHVEQALVGDVSAGLAGSILFFIAGLASADDGLFPTWLLGTYRATGGLSFIWGIFWVLFWVFLISALSIWLIRSLSSREKHSPQPHPGQFDQFGRPVWNGQPWAPRTGPANGGRAPGRQQNARPRERRRHRLRRPPAVPGPARMQQLPQMQRMQPKQQVQPIQKTHRSRRQAPRTTRTARRRPSPPRAPESPVRLTGGRPPGPRRCRRAAAWPRSLDARRPWGPRPRPSERDDPLRARPECRGCRESRPECRGCRECRECPAPRPDPFTLPDPCRHRAPASRAPARR